MKDKIRVFTDKSDNKIVFDIEPTWETLCHIASEGGLNAIELLNACKVADIVRQAQKSGKKSIKFTFKGKKVQIDEEE